MAAPAPSKDRLAPMLTAYKILLGRAANKLSAPAESWDSDVIDVDREERLLAGDAEYRLAPYPFPGLRSFTPNEGDLFFGRNRSISEVQDMLKRQRLVIVCGGSGSGKSSLLRAGLLPFLNTSRRIEGRHGNWYYAEFRPRTDPMRALACAIADQLLLRFADLGKPQVNEALGLAAGLKGEPARKALREAMHERFEAARAIGRKALVDTLLAITGPELDRLDKCATGGIRVPGPSLLLLLDQFEEVFRPEVSPSSRAVLLDLIADLHARLRDPSVESGLFLAITLRSEELYRCAEHREVSEVVNRSLYLLELLDPANAEDAADLRRAMIKPARNVFEDWGLELDPDNPDAPFARGVPDWLLAGAGHLPAELEHRSDQLPLLQHALQATWHAAIRTWSQPGFEADRLEIQREYLPGNRGDPATPPDLGECLRNRADQAAASAAGRCKAIEASVEVDGTAALRAVFRALARRDERGNWARCFAEPADLEAFLAVEPNLAKLPAATRAEAGRRVLNVFALRGYLSGGDGQPYDISHEALIRNWPAFIEWLREPGEVAYALARVMQEIDPAQFMALDDTSKRELIPAEISRRVNLVAAGGVLPERWGADQIANRLTQPAMYARWGGAPHAALAALATLAQVADKARTDIATAAEKRRLDSATAVEKMRADAAIAAEKARADLAAAQAKAEAERATASAFKKRKNQVVGLSVAVFTLGCVVVAMFAYNYNANTNSIRQLSARILISAMQTENDSSPWRSGAREGAALNSLAILDGSAGINDSNARLEASSNRSWQTGVRTLLGHYDITEADASPPGAARPACSTVEAPNDAVAQLKPGVKAMPDVRFIPDEQVKIRLGDQVLNAAGVNLETSAGQAWHPVDSAMSVRPQAGSRICLSADASIVTISSIGQDLPLILELQWSCTASQEVCRQGQGWSVSGQLISATKPIRASPPPNTFPCVTSIVPAPPGGKKLNASAIFFTAGADSTACDADPTKPSYQAEYFPGLFIPLLMPGSTVHHPPPAMCQKPSPQQLAGEPQLLKTCQFNDPSGSPLVLNVYPGISGWKSLQLLRADPAAGNLAPVINAPLFATDIGGAATNEDGDLVVVDPALHSWILTLDENNHDRFKAALRLRACHPDECDYPTELPRIVPTKNDHPATAHR